MLEVLCGHGGGCLAFCLLSHSTFSSSFKFFSFALRIRVGLPHPLAINVTHCICGQPLKSCKDSFFSVDPMLGNKLHPTIWFEMLLLPL